MCYWPKINEVSKAKNCAIPDKEKWSLLKIRIFCHADTYENATRKCNLVLDTSTIETDDDADDVVKSRRTKKPKRLIEEEDSEDDMDQTQSKGESRKTFPDPLSSAQTCQTQLPKPPSLVSSASKSPGSSRNTFEHVRWVHSRVASETPASSFRPVSASSSENSIENARQTSPYSPSFVASGSSALGCRPVPSSHIYDERPMPPLSTPRRSGSFAPESNSWENVRWARSATFSPTESSSTSFSPVIPNYMYDERHLPSLSTPRRHENTIAPGIAEKMFDEINAIKQRQEEMVVLLRQIVASKSNNDVVVEDIISHPCQDQHELDQLEESLQDSEFRKKLIALLGTLAGAKLGETIRKMLRMLGTNTLWSEYSLKGKRNKLAFASLSLHKVVTKACLKVHKNVNISHIEETIGETLKHCPAQKDGPGPRYLQANEQGQQGQQPRQLQGQGQQPRQPQGQQPRQPQGQGQGQQPRQPQGQQPRQPQGQGQQPQRQQQQSDSSDSD